MRIIHSIFRETPRSVPPAIVETRTEHAAITVSCNHVGIPVIADARPYFIVTAGLLLLDVLSRVL